MRGWQYFQPGFLLSVWIFPGTGHIPHSPAGSRGRPSLSHPRCPLPSGPSPGSGTGPASPLALSASGPNSRGRTWWSSSSIHVPFQPSHPSASVLCPTAPRDISRYLLLGLCHPCAANASAGEQTQSWSCTLGFKAKEQKPLFEKTSTLWTSFQNFHFKFMEM